VRVSDFHFDLPEELIAQHPPAQRGSSRMLFLNRATERLTDAWFRELPEFLRAGDLLVLNDSRVLPARLFAVRAGVGTQGSSPQPTGLIEVLLVEEVGSREQGTGDRDQGTGDREQGLVWRALVKPAKKVRVGELLQFCAGVGGEVVLTSEVVGAGEFGERTLRFAPVEDFYERVARIGHMPLPPYIHRDQAVRPDTAEDRERYQTVYAQQLGSAAAPTAGLHFTPEILDALRERGVEIATLTLHVGLGTFQPVRVSDLKDIHLHSERYTLPAATAEALNRAIREGRRVIAVGTTTTRALEHVAAEAEKANHRERRERERAQILGAPPQWKFEAHSGATSIFIGPGHRFRIVDGLLTNFHLPESTLLMLVSAFAGDGDAGRQRVLAAYAHAIRQGYRFYSYGDCMLVL
jgi:S-adenosylmethionine:tRNA ribosyltransferase-isomerase